MTRHEAIHRASLRKHRHKGPYAAKHEQLAEELQREEPRKRSGDPHFVTLFFWVLICITAAGIVGFWQDIKRWWS
jgi:hypothetical protein